MFGTSLSPAKYTSSWVPMMKSAAISAAKAMMMALMSMGGIASITGRLLVEFSAGGDDARGCFGIAGGDVQEHLIGLDGEHRHVTGTRGNVAIRKTHRVLAQEIRGGGDRAVLLPAGIGGIVEAPARDAVIDHRPAITRLHSGGSEDTAIVGPAGIRTMRVDRAASGPIHRAMPLRVVAHEPRALRLAKRRDQVLRANAAQRFALPRTHLDVVGRGAAANAVATGHLHAGPSSQRAAHGVQPRGKISRGQ